MQIIFCIILTFSDVIWFLQESEQMEIRGDRLFHPEGDP